MRTAFNIILILSVLFMPWWASAIILLIACFVVEHFYEAVIYGIAVDALYGSSFGVYGFHYLATAFSVIVLSISLFLRKRLSW